MIRPRPALLAKEKADPISGPPALLKNAEPFAAASPSNQRPVPGSQGTLLPVHGAVANAPTRGAGTQTRSP